MKKTAIVLYIAAALIGVYVIVSTCLASMQYAQYIESYGIDQVLPAILQVFFEMFAWPFVLIGIASIINNMPKRIPMHSAMAPNQCRETNIDDLVKQEQMKIDKINAQIAEENDKADEAERIEEAE